ncbi:MAG: hypothetical protein HQK89_02835 [Nitrospirae bacterium]|nr:hypothetical protein [Nitrospirota bacterium]
MHRIKRFKCPHCRGVSAVNVPDTQETVNVTDTQQDNPGKDEALPAEGDSIVLRVTCPYCGRDYEAKLTG